MQDRDLLAYLDGEAGHQVVAHVEQCLHCRDRAQRLARLQERMTAELYRITCPSPLELGEYDLGVMSEERAAEVGQHLAECPHCGREVAQLKGYLGELASDLELSPLEQIKVWVAQLVSGAEKRGQPAKPALAPAYAAVRGEEAAPRVYQAGEAQVVIDIQEDAAQPDRRVLLGLVTGIDAGELVSYLWLAEERVAQAPVDELGNFVMAGLAPARYELILRGPEVEIQIRDLEVEES